MEDVEFNSVATENCYSGEEKKVQSLNDCNQAEPEQYLCPNCGSENIIVIESSDYMQDQFGICNCYCGYSEDGVAAEREELIHGSEYQIGWLNSEGDIDWDGYDREIIEKDVIECIVYCQGCFGESGWDDWEREYGEIDSDVGSYWLEIYCRNCEHKADYSPSLFE